MLSQTDTQPKMTFGQTFLPDLAMAEGDANSWQPLQCIPFGDMEQSPAWSAIHYGQCAFEGLKAHPSPQGLRLFRPYAHYVRLQSSCERLAMVCPPWEHFLAALKAVLKRASGKTPIYLRPLVTAQEAFLGVRPAKKYRFIVMACEALPYFAHSGLRLRTETQWSRAFAGGTGAVKTPGNYAAAVLASSTAKSEGFDDVLWLDAAEHAHIEEAGAMNVFFRMGNAWYTPNLNGSILPGITRDTVLRLFRKMGITAHEKRISLQELASAYREGWNCEAFGTGTAAGIAPIAELWHQGEMIFSSRLPVETQKPESHQTAQIQKAFQNLWNGGRSPTWSHPLDGWIDV